MPSHLLAHTIELPALLEVMSGAAVFANCAVYSRDFHRDALVLGALFVLWLVCATVTGEADCGPPVNAPYDPEAAHTVVYVDYGPPVNAPYDPAAVHAMPREMSMYEALASDLYAAATVGTAISLAFILGQ